MTGRISTGVHETVSVCANCGCPLTGPYCSQCGEKRFDPHAHTVRHFVIHYLLNSAFITGVQFVGAALALWTL